MNCIKRILSISVKAFLVWLLYTVICLVIPPLFHKTTDTALRQTEDWCDAEGAAAQERILSIDDNREALIWRLRLIESAKEKIVLTTFDFRSDNSGKDIMAALLQAADRGVEVQILVDGIYGIVGKQQLSGAGGP